MLTTLKESTHGEAGGAPAMLGDDCNEDSCIACRVLIARVDGCSLKDL